MKRIESTMSAAELQAWRDRHEHSLASGADALGVSRAQFMFYLNGRYDIPQTIALLCAALDRLSRKRSTP